jgi:hypothetical protein
LTPNSSIAEWRVCFIVFSFVLFLAGLIFVVFSEADLQVWAKKNRNVYQCDGGGVDNPGVENELLPSTSKNNNDELLLQSDSFDQTENNFKNTILTINA